MIEIEETSELRIQSASEPKIQVLCAWCGAEIREGDEPEWSGMCQACFRHMVSEQLRLATQSHEHASER